MDFLQRECGQGTGGERGRRGRDAAGRSTRGSSAAGGGSSKRSDSRLASAKGVPQSRDGDWRCSSCSFQPNFGFRQKCWKCGKARGAQQPAGGGKFTNLAAGPIGANSSRPLLGGGPGRMGADASGDKSPTFRVPGASVAAKAVAARASAAAASSVQATGIGKQGMGGGGNAGTGSSKCDTNLLDEDGFQTVRRRGGRARNSAAGDLARELGSDADDVDMAGNATPGAEDEEGVDEDDDDGAEAEPEPTALRQRWQQEIVVVKQLARQGIKPDHPAMVAACEARDEAEKKWREAKSPAPLATRLGWAQKKLDRAIGIQAETRLEMVELEKDFNAKWAVLQARMEEDSERVNKRRRQLQTVQEEAGGSATQRLRGGGGEAVRKACDTLRHTVAPALVELAEQLGTGTEAWATVNGLLSTLSSSQQVMEEALDNAAPTFNMAYEDESVWSESHDLRDSPFDHDAQAADGGGMYAQQQQQCTHQAWQQHQPQHLQQEQQWSDQREQNYGGDGGDAMHWHHWHQAGWTCAPRWRENGHGQWTRTSWADAWESEHCADADMDEPPEPQCKHRRQGGATYDKDEAAAGTGGGDPGMAGQSSQAPSQQRVGEGDRHHAEMLANVVAAAVKAGVQPITASGEDLQLLDAQQLAAWAAENIPPN